MVDRSTEIGRPRFRDGRSASARPDPVELSVIIPCYNEALHLEATLLEWGQALSAVTQSFELIVINDGSTDGTGRILDRVRKEIPYLRVLHQLNGGINHCYERGVEMARGTYLFLADASRRLETDDFLRLWELRNQYSCLAAYRTHRLDNTFRRLYALTLKKALQWFFHLELNDADCPYRLVRAEVALPFFEQLRGRTQSFPLLMTVLVAQEFPEQYKEMPVPYRNRPPESSPRGPSQSVFSLVRQTFGDLMQLRWQNARESITWLPARRRA